MPKHVWTIASVLCTQVLEEKNGHLSIIRIADRVFVPPPPPDSEAGITLAALFVLRGDEAGDHTLNIHVHTPLRKNAQTGTPFPFRIEGPAKGLNLNTNVALELDGEGLYWLDVLIDNELSVRIPLDVSFQTPPETSK